MSSLTNPIVLDTDTFSEIARGKNAVIASQAAAHWSAGRPFPITIASVVEIVAGWQACRRPHNIDLFVASLGRDVEVLPLNQMAAILAGRIMGDLRRTGQPIGSFDPLIAAIAITSSRTLITGNTRHYQRIIDLGYDLQLDDWREPPSA